MSKPAGDSNMAAAIGTPEKGLSMLKSWPRAIRACCYLAAPLFAPIVFVPIVFAPMAAEARSPLPTAIFNFGFDDTSLQGQQQGVQPAQQQRLQALDAELREMLAKSGCCEVVPTAPVAQQSQDIDMWSCNGCDLDLARKLGARISVTGWVQKVSNLILNINLVARNVTTGQVIEAGSVDIRGNTDETWSRGLAYLLRNRLHPADW